MSRAGGNFYRVIDRKELYAYCAICMVGLLLVVYEHTADVPV